METTSVKRPSLVRKSSRGLLFFWIEHIKELLQETTFKKQSRYGIFKGLLWIAELHGVFYGCKTFKKSSMGTRPSRSLQWILHHKEVFNGWNASQRSTMDRRPFRGLLWVEDHKGTFVERKSLRGLLLREHLSSGLLRLENHQEVSYRCETFKRSSKTKSSRGLQKKTSRGLL